MAEPLRALTLVSMCWRNLHRQPLRTILTALGVSIGVAAIVAFGSLARGLHEAMNAAIRFGEGDMMVFQSGIAADIFSTLDEAETGALLLADPDVVRVSPTLWHVMPAPKMIFGFTIGLHRQDMGIHQEHLLRGRMPQTDDEVLLGRAAARLSDKDVNDDIYLAGRRFVVAGVFETGIVFFDGAIVMSLERLQGIAQRPGKVTAFQVKVRPGVDPDVVGERISRDHHNLATVSSATQYKRIDQGLEIANGMVRGVSFLAILIGSVIVTNTMWMTVHERTREIGVLRAVGWARRKIVAAVIVESMGVGLLGGVLGCALGMGLAKLSVHAPFGGQFLNPVFAWQPFAIAVAVALLLSILGGALPAWRAARISPVEALRYE